MQPLPIQVRVFDDNPSGYDAFQSFFLEKIAPARQMLEALFAALDMQPADRVLEVGMGTGLNLPFYPKSVQLHGIDLSEAMLELARTRLSELGREAQLRVGDAYALPYPDAHFDKVTCIFVLCTLDRPEQALAEMLRVCKPGGRIALFDYHRSEQPDTQFAQQFFNETMRQGVSFGGQPVIVCDSMYQLDGHLAGRGATIAHDARMDRGVAQSFRATVVGKA